MTGIKQLIYWIHFITYMQVEQQNLYHGLYRTVFEEHAAVSFTTALYSPEPLTKSFDKAPSNVILERNLQSVVGPR